jgi:4-hydroxybenzoate polyprenyltransferase
MDKWVAVPLLQQGLWGEQLPNLVLALLVVSVVLIAAGGYVINDYFDVKIDRINRPDDLVVSNTISKERAMLLFQILTAVGVLMGLGLSIYLRSWLLSMIYVLIPGILWFYSSSYKRQLILGNIVVALIMALLPMMVVFANVAQMSLKYGDVVQYSPVISDLYLWIGGFSLFAFLCTWIREIVKDMQDQVGDREYECHTLPICIGDVWTKVIVTILTLVVMVLLIWINYFVVPYPHDFSTMTTRFTIFGLLIPFACSLVLLWAAKLPSDYSTVQHLLKFIMFMGVMYSFVIHQQFAY